MRAYLVYLQLELKKALNVLPKFLAGAIVLSAILGTIAFSAGMVLYRDEIVNQISIGVVLPADDSLAQTAIRMLTSLDNVKDVCDFKYIDEATGRAELASGSLHALMLVPEGFVEGVMTGVNTPVTMVLPERSGVESLIFREMADSGARTLGVAQASIYAVDELCIAYGLPNEIRRAEEELNRIYFAYALPRTEYFREYRVSATGDVNVIWYYGMSAAVLFLFLCGIPLAPLCRRDRPVLVKKLQGIGISTGLQVFAKIIAVAFLLILISGAGVSCLICLKVIRYSQAYLLSVLLACFTVAAVIVMIYAITKSQMASVMCLFWLSVGMVFLSGGFIPLVFLPEAFRDLKALVPATPLIELLKAFSGTAVSTKAIVQSSLWGTGCFLAAVVGRRRL